MVWLAKYVYIILRSMDFLVLSLTIGWFMCALTFICILRQMMMNCRLRHRHRWHQNCSYISFYPPHQHIVHYRYIHSIDNEFVPYLVRQYEPKRKLSVLVSNPFSGFNMQTTHWFLHVHANVKEGKNKTIWMILWQFGTTNNLKNISLILRQKAHCLTWKGKIKIDK